MASVPSTPQAVAAAGGVLFDGGGRVLLVRRGRPPGAGTWSLPGGRIEAGEAPADAAVREVFEETSLRTRAVCCSLGVVDVAAEGYRYAIHEHLLALVDPPASALRAGDDASEVRWVAIAALADFAVSPAVAQVIARGVTAARAVD